MSSHLFKTVTAVSACIVSTGIMAAGPLVLDGPTGNTPVTYTDPNIVLDIETGPLGIRPNAAAAQLVTDAVALWNNTTTATISINTTGTGVTEDINSTNWDDYLPTPPTDYNDQDGINPVVFDSDGEIIDAILGLGASDNIVGFASSIFLVGTSRFTEGFAVVNGKIGLTDDELRLVIAHEIGHYFGLDHSQTNIDNTESSCPPIWTDTAAYPLMYPYACRNAPSLHPDDEMSVSMLYPAADFNQTHGQIIGTFLLPDGTPVRGANIWVEEENGDVYSMVSDYLKENTGLFNLRLPPGKYTLHANSINNVFFDSSSVGPYADDQYGLSFQDPAASIGDVTLMDNTGTTAVVFNVTADSSIDITFYSDGTGTYTSGKAITDPTVVNSFTPSGGGGILNPFVALLIPALVLSRRRL